MRRLSPNDLLVWARKANWTARQASCIFSGLEPSSVYGEHSLPDAERAKYLGTKAFIRDNFKGVHFGKLLKPPGEWISWARTIGLYVEPDVSTYIEQTFPAENHQDAVSRRRRNPGRLDPPVEAEASANTLLETQGGNSTHDPRERKSMLRIIRALDVMAGLPGRGGAPSIEKQLHILGFEGPKDATIRKVLDEARTLEPENKPQ